MASNRGTFVNAHTSLGGKGSWGYNREPIKTTYHRELWIDGPVRVEAWRLATIEAKAIIRSKGLNPDNYSKKAIDKMVTVILFNSGATFLQRAKFNLKID